MGLEALERRARLTSVALWLLAFMCPLYVQGEGFVYSNELIFRVLSSSLIYRLVEAAWPSLILHLLAYYLAYRALRGDARPFLAYSGAAYLAIAVGQSTAVLDGRVVSLVSNAVLTVAVGALWIRDCLRPVEFEGRGSGWLPLALFAFAAPAASAGGGAPWSWMWAEAASRPYMAIPAVLADALAGYGPVAYCLYTPLALTVAGGRGALRPLTLRLTSILGVVYSSIILVFSLLEIALGWIPPGRQALALWNAVLHLPLLATCSYYFAVGWPPAE